MKNKNIVIVGAGFAGISTYLSLPKSLRKNHNITIVNKENYFLFTPLIHELATGALNAYHVTEPIRKLIDAETRFIQTTVTSIDVEQKEISLLLGKKIPYDILVIAMGSTTNFFNTIGAEKYAHTLKNLDDAKSMRNHFLDTFESASLEVDSNKRKEMLSFVIVGGGPTGVELAAEAAELFFDTFHEYYKNFINFDEISLSLVNSGENLLRPFKKKFQKYAKNILLEKNVNIINNTCVAEINADNVVFSDGKKISASTVIWAAGVQANDVKNSADFEVIKGSISVNEYLNIPNHNDIFVLGDMSHFPTDDGRGLPMLAQVAKQQGIVVGKNIGRLISGKKIKKFKYRSRGNLASLGQWHAIADLHYIGFTGVFAWFVWRTIYLHNFASWRKRFKITLDWTINIFSKRDITRS